MVRQIVWTRLAQNQRFEIFEYWNLQNKSNSYSKRLNDLFEQNIELLSKFPLIGTRTQIENVRVKIIKKYLIIYRLNEKTIYILSIWDSRKNPEDLNRLIQLYQ